MKVLLIGEFSGFHKNLKEGLLELGIDVLVMSSGDSWKKIESDIPLSPYKGFFSFLRNRLHDYFKLKNVKNYDVIQFMSPFILYSSFFPREKLFKNIVKNNKLVYLIAAGGDSFFWINGPNALKYGPFEGTFKYDPVHFINRLKQDRNFKYNKLFAKNVKRVIPVMFEYKACYLGIDNLSQTIPMPINTSKVSFKENIVNDKIVIMHGLNRYGFKGTNYVEEAFMYLQKKYPDDLELIIDGNLPLDKYLTLMERTNVVVDQMNSHSLGMNGLYALAMGKVVIGGSEPESLDSFRITESPVINVKPSSKDLIAKIEYLLENKKLITGMGKESRTFVEMLHGHKKVAKQYLDIWSS